MKNKWKLSIIVALILHLILWAVAKAEENTMNFKTVGIVFPCSNEATNPYGTCFMVENNRWGGQTPGYDPATGTKIDVTFTFQRNLNPKREHEDGFYVTSVKVHIPTLYRIP